MGVCVGMNPQSPIQFADDALFLSVLEDALSIQDRFVAEPVYSRTGKGYLKSAGVEELKQIKAAKLVQKDQHSQQ